MRVSHIYHSGFVCELDAHSLVFDWWRGEDGSYALPELRTDVPLLVFVSHEHADHYDRCIWELAERFEQLNYVVDRAIAGRVPAALAARTLVVDANRSYELAGCRIQTLESNDEGVSFFVECEGRTIYYGADLNVWWWDRPQKENEASLAFCTGQLEQLPQGPYDLAFLALDPRLVDGLIGLLTFEKLRGAKHIFPMHYWSDVSASQRLLSDERCTPELERKIHFANSYDID